LLCHIKRATKSDQQSKDEVESLRSEICSMRECFQSSVKEFDRKINDLSYEFNRRITAVNSEYDKLATIVHHIMATTVSAQASAMAAAAAQAAASNAPSSFSISPPLPQVHQQHAMPAPIPAASATAPSTLLQSLGQVAASAGLPQQNAAQAVSNTMATTIQQLAVVAAAANTSAPSSHEQHFGAAIDTGIGAPPALNSDAFASASAAPMGAGCPIDPDAAGLTNKGNKKRKGGGSTSDTDATSQRSRISQV
jgi:hypothetical protein